MKVYERQITRDDPDYDEVTRMLGDMRRYVPDERAWLVYDERPHLEVETFQVDAGGDYMLNDTGDDILINPKRSIVWID